MAERRMFAKTIIDSDAFLDMPLSTQSLYFHLSMRADDDGFINNPKKIQRMIGSSDDDLRVLVAKKFIIPFDSGIVVIKHWKIHNYIRSDRYKETVYQEEKSLLETKENKAYTFGIPDVYHLDTQVRLGKDSLGKDSIDIVELDKPIPKQTSKPAKHKYGEYQHVLLTDTEFNNLARDFSNDLREKAIKFLDEYIEETGYKKKSHYLTIRRWVIDAVKEQEQKQTKQTKTSKPNQFNNFQQRSYSTAEMDALERKLLGLDKPKPLTDEELKEAEELKQELKEKYGKG